MTSEPNKTNGWWLASDGRWYPPEQRPEAESGTSSVCPFHRNSPERVCKQGSRVRVPFLPLTTDNLLLLG
jgi:hypothetical protein